MIKHIIASSKTFTNQITFIIFRYYCESGGGAYVVLRFLVQLKRFTVILKPYMTCNFHGANNMPAIPY